jgi:Pyruvate/2-oxoacid:ferredoxin oxidoreductase delta subunit
MGHLAGRSDVLRCLRERLDKNPIGLPEDLHIYEILSIIFTEEEACLAANFPLKPVSLEELSGIVPKSKKKLQKLINSMMEKGLVLESNKRGRTHYILSMALVGFFEFIFMKTNHGLPLNELAPLINQYRLGDRFTQELFNINTPRARTLIYETVSSAIKSEVLTYEMATELIKESGRGGITNCYCRHESYHVGNQCIYPLDLCISLGPASDFLIKKGFARRASLSELVEKLHMAKELGLMHLCDNVMSQAAFICNCCGCCCCFLAGITKHHLPHAVSSTNHVAVVDSKTCTGCCLCTQKCQIGAISLLSDNKAEIDAAKCLGCGVCASFCKQKAITFKGREKKIIPPANIGELIGRRQRDRLKD